MLTTRMIAHVNACIFMHEHMPTHTTPNPIITHTDTHWHTHNSLTHAHKHTSTCQLTHMHQFTGMHWCTQVYIFSYAHTCQLTQTVHSYTRACGLICTQSHMTLKTCQFTIAHMHAQPPTPMHNSHSNTHANSHTHTNSHAFTHTAASQGHTPRPSTEGK